MSVGRLPIIAAGAPALITALDIPALMALLRLFKVEEKERYALAE